MLATVSQVGFASDEPPLPLSSSASSPYSLGSANEEGAGNYPDALPAAPIALKTPWESNLWARVINGFSIPDLSGDIVERHERVYANNPDYIRKLIERGRPYLYYVTNEVERRGMPMEVALLPMIESAFNPYAYSRAHASGLWQIIPSTGRNLGLSQNIEHDERRDVMAATRSALDYLEYLHTLFPDWQLALAAYNWGEGALGRSVARNQSRGLPVNYWSISMPSETRNYVPKLQALKNIIRNPGAYGIEIPLIPDRPYFRSVAVDKRIGVEKAARLADISVNEFSSLNPAFKKPIINGSSDNQYRLLIPVEKAETFEGRIKGAPATVVASNGAAAGIEPFNPSGWASSQMKEGEKSQDLAPRLSLSAEELKNMNGLKGEVRIGAGQTLWVPPDIEIVQPALKTTAANTEDEEIEQLAETVQWVRHRSARHETINTIARRYNVSPDDIRRWNHLSGDLLKRGTLLRLRVLVVKPPTARRHTSLRHRAHQKARRAITAPKAVSVLKKK